MSLYQRLVRDVFTPLALWRAGDLDQLAYRREFERTQWLSADELRDLQWRRLRTLVEQAYRECPFYRERFDRLGLRPDDFRAPEDLRVLPPLEKRDIQEHGERLLARNWPRDDLVRNQTGGSTGTPITFYLSKDRKCSRAAATAGAGFPRPTRTAWTRTPAGSGPGLAPRGATATGGRRGCEPASGRATSGSDSCRRAGRVNAPVLRFVGERGV